MILGYSQLGTLQGALRNPIGGVVLLVAITPNPGMSATH